MAPAATSTRGRWMPPPRPGQDHLGKGLSGHDRQILIRRPGQLSWGPSWGQPGSATGCPADCSIKSLCPEPSHAISTEQSQPRLRLLKSHFHQTAVKRDARGGLAMSHY